jgi:anti-sigma regulatory factor (Ser/Thr protein kinase)
VGRHVWGNEVLAADLVGPLVFDLASSTGCPHHVHTMLMPMRQTSPLRCAPVSQTPTGEQRGDQRFDADTTAGGADLQESCRLSPGAEVVFGPVGAGGDLVVNQHDPSGAYPAGPSASDAPLDAAVCGPSISHTTAAHQHNAPAHAASSIPGSRALGHSRAAPDATLRRDAQSDEQRTLAQGCRSEALPASARGAEVRTTPPVLPSQGRGTGLATSDAGNLWAMVRSGDHVPSHGSTVQQLAAPSLDVTVPATTQNATALRRSFRRWVGSLIADDAAEDLTLAVYEALTNAAEHAFITHRAPGSIWLRAVVADGHITVTVTDNGSWRRPTNSGGHRGRGLPLIHQLTTEAYVAPSPYGTTVRLRRRQLYAEQYDELA